MAGQTAEEHQLKAAFLYHVANFVTWPEDAEGTASGPFVIGVLGSNPIEPYLEALRGERIRGRGIRVLRIDAVRNVDDVQVLFVDASETPNLPRLLEATAGRPLLTVGESPGFTQSGGTLRWFVEEGRLQLEVNLCAVERAGLTISARLLRLAHITVGSCEEAAR